MPRPKRGTTALSDPRTGILSTLHGQADILEILPKVCPNELSTTKLQVAKRGAERDRRHGEYLLMLFGESVFSFFSKKIDGHYLAAKMRKL